VAVGLCAVVLGAASLADKAATVPAGEGESTVLERAVAAGQSWRLDTPSGPVHVWVPLGYHPDGAATVVYVHGYYTDIDKAWVNHRLAQQFALAGINALFIAPEAPSGTRQQVFWTSLGDLLLEVQRQTGVARPMGPVIAVGHSGGFRTLFAWMDYPGLDIVVSMDAMYGELDTWREWLDGAPRRRLIVVGDDTVRWTEELARELGDQVVTIERFPTRYLDLPPAARDGRVVYLRSQYGHMPLVTDGVALPLVLHLIPAEMLPEAPWREPLGLPAIDAGVIDGALAP